MQDRLCRKKRRGAEASTAAATAMECSVFKRRIQHLHSSGHPRPRHPINSTFLLFRQPIIIFAPQALPTKCAQKWVGFWWWAARWCEDQEMCGAAAGRTCQQLPNSDPTLPGDVTLLDKLSGRPTKQCSWSRSRSRRGNVLLFGVMFTNTGRQ